MRLASRMVSRTRAVERSSSNSTLPKKRHVGMAVVWTGFAFTSNPILQKGACLKLALTL